MVNKEISRDQVLKFVSELGIEIHRTCGVTLEIDPGFVRVTVNKLSINEHGAYSEDTSKYSFPISKN